MECLRCDINLFSKERSGKLHLTSSKVLDVYRKSEADEKSFKKAHNLRKRMWKNYCSLFLFLDVRSKVANEQSDMLIGAQLKAGVWKLSRWKLKKISVDWRISKRSVCIMLSSLKKRVSGKPDQIFFCNLNGGVIRNYTIKVAMISVKAQF